MKVIVINGMPRVGKDLFVSLCQKNKNYQVFNFSTVDFVKEIATKCGWSGEKTPESRKFLSDLKDLLSAAPWYDVPIHDIKKKIDIAKLTLEQCGLSDFNMVVFIHAREPENIEKIKNKFNASTLLIHRLEVEKEQSNHADSNVFDYDYDYNIYNNGTVDELMEISSSFLDLIFKEN